MARPRRSHQNHVFYHVMLRGNDGQDIFKSDDDRLMFCGLLNKANERTGCTLHCYCLMSNHVHLLMQNGTATISNAIHYCAGNYARYFNDNYDRKGHLFQDRFCHKAVHDGVYLKKAVRYIHLNPVRAFMVRDPLAYGWSSHRLYVGQTAGLLACDSTAVLSHFGANALQAISNYKEYIVQAVSPRELEAVRYHLRTGEVKLVASLDEIRAAIAAHQGEVADPAALYGLIAYRYAKHPLKAVAASLCKDITVLSRAINKLQIKIERDAQSHGLLQQIMSTIQG